MTMLRLDPQQRAVLAEKLADLANLFAGGFVIGQYLSDGPASIALVVFGLSMWIVVMALALVAAGGER